MAGCEITIDASVFANTTGIACNLNSSTDDSTARSLSASGSGASGILTITFTTGSTASNIAQPVLASAIDKFALESNA